MTKKKRNLRCAVFVIDEEVKYYNGTLAALKLQITDDEWDHLVKCTVEYCAYVACLKSTACPKLDESWEAEDEVYLLELRKTIKQIKALDPFILAKYNYDDTVAKLSKVMAEKAEELAQEIKEVAKLTDQIVNDTRKMQVSEL